MHTDSMVDFLGQVGLKIFFVNKAKCFFLKTLCCLSVHAFGSLNFYLEHSKFNDLLNSIRSKCKSCASWPDPAKAIRASQVSRPKFHFIECCSGLVRYVFFSIYECL